MRVFDVNPDKALALGGGMEGAERISRETANWTPSTVSPNRQIALVKPMADARSQDRVQNDGYVNGAVAIHRDSIVGSQYRLNARPVAEVLGVSDTWLKDFQLQTEALFNLLADNQECWFDASGRLTFTGLIRLSVASYTMTGEALSSVEWDRTPNRPFKTSIQVISPSRLSNPNMSADQADMISGIKIDPATGRPLSYWIRNCHPGDELLDQSRYGWTEVPARKPWGRRQILHVFEPLLPAQARGVGDMVSVLKNMRMTSNFQDIVLQNAVVNASYAAVIESELPAEMVFGQIGVGQPTFQDQVTGYLNNLAQFLTNSKSLTLDGVKIPHLYPGTKLNLQPLGTPGGIGSNFEASMLRHIAAALGLSYEQFSRDYTNTNYSSARASLAETEKFMRARKRMVADRKATMIYELWLEEMINAGVIALPPGKDLAWFYNPIIKAALSNCTWIGSGRGQIDEYKETQAAALRVSSNFTTLEQECAEQGRDWREVLAQRKREKELMVEYGLAPDPAAVAQAGGADPADPADNPDAKPKDKGAKK